jgi:cytochrome c oxidase assembly factor CtaG
MARVEARRRPAARRLLAALLAALPLAAVAAPAASAHVGRPTSTVEAGPYRLVIDAGPFAVGTRSALAFDLRVTDERSGEPIEGATVRIRVVGGEGSARPSYRTSRVGDSYSENLPIPSADRWRTLRFTVAVAGRLGDYSAVYVPPSLLGEWLFEPVPLALAALAAALFLQGFVRLRRRGRADHASFGRLALFAAGLGLTVAALVSPLDPVGDQFLLSAHMLQHLLIGDAGPALMLVAVRGPLVFFLLPAPLMRILGRSERVRDVAASLVRPRVALGAWALAYGAWHIPSFYDYAATHQLVHDAEHASFVVAGVLVWSLLVDPAGQRRLSRGRRLAVAAGLFAMGTVIADVLIFSLHPLYPLYANQAERVFSLSPLHDQQLAGLVMIVEQALTLGTFAVVMLLPALRARRREREFVAGRERLA